MKRKTFFRLLPFTFFLPLTLKASVLSFTAKVLLGSVLVFNTGTSQMPSTTSASTYPCFQDITELKSAVDNYIAGTQSSSEEDLGPIGTWCVKDVTDMSYLFKGKGDFNEALNNWDVSSVTNMTGMFFGAESFNQDLSSWNVSSVTDMNKMFFSAYSFNQDLSSWNVSSVTDMNKMFFFAGSFNQDLSSWNVSSVTDMSYMFDEANSFAQDLCEWGDRMDPFPSVSCMFCFSLCGRLNDPEVNADGVITPLCYDCTT